MRCSLPSIRRHWWRVGDRKAVALMDSNVEEPPVLKENVRQGS